MSVPRAVGGLRSEPVTLFLCGDVMTGRGIDQVLPHPSAPQLYEPVVRDAVEYVELAERASGAILAPVDPSYVWGDALEELDRMSPDARIINLETAITAVDEPWGAKEIHYRMHPRNVGCLSAAGIDCCVLANNHVLDWGPAGLDETLSVLDRAGVATAGAGHDLDRAGAPAIVERAGRVLVFAFGSVSSGIPPEWAATARSPGVNLLEDLSPDTVRDIAVRIHRVRRDGDVVVVSIHWGPNWGYHVARRHRRFAHALIDDAGVDVVHGHSSHHPKGIEVYRDRPVLYGCGDFLNDYEGISGYRGFRGDLVLMYFATIDPVDRRLVRLRLTPLQIRRFRLHRASSDDRVWLRDTLNHACGTLGTRVESAPEGTLRVRWNRQ